MVRRAAITAARVGVLSALSAVGAMFPLPSPVGSVALDSFPGYFAALAFGPLEGALVAAIGHLLSAMRAGMPLGLLHIVAVAPLMAAVGVVTALVKRKLGVIPGLAAGVVVNVAGAPIAVPVFGWGILAVFVPLLTVASVVNAAVAGIVYRALVAAKVVE
jgi:uncharacterized membrane protein